MTLTRWSALLALAVFTAVNAPLSAADTSDKAAVKLPDTELPKPAEVQELTAKPEKVSLKGLDDANQFVITARTTAGKLIDLKIGRASCREGVGISGRQLTL